MVDTVIICEKASLGRDVANALSNLKGVKAESNSQYIKVGDDYVTWFAGHVYRQASPKAYYDGRWAKYSLSTLPIIVDSNDWIMEPDENKKALIKNVRDLAKQAKTIINCGDADREGQLLVDEALQVWGIDPFGPNVKRLWAQDNSLEPMKKAITNAYPNKEKKTLYEAGLARARADWEHGMTFSRAFQLFVQMGGAQNQTISVGRVQTPALSLIVKRDLERMNFKPVQHFKGQVVFHHDNGDFQTNWVMPSADEMEERFPGSMDSEGRLIKKETINEILAKVAGKQGTVKAYSNKLKPVQQPLGFDLAALQRDAGRKLNMTSKEVLDTLQELYDNKITSYPRTDSEYLTTGIREGQVEKNLAELAKIPELKDLVDGCNLEIKSPIWNNSKVDSHYAIIPADDFNVGKFEALSGNKREIFLMVARRLIAQFYPPHTYHAISATVECEGENFKGTGKKIKENGWKDVYKKSGVDEEEEKNEDDSDNFPEMSEGDGVSEVGHKEVAMMTTPPPAFNDANFVGKGGALEKVYLFESDPEIKKRLKEADGLGRPATRAGIVETLLRRQFIKRKGKTGLESTELGRSLIDIMPQKLISVGLTAIWESKFDQIENGELELDTFMEELSETLKNMVDEEIQSHPNGVKLKGVKLITPLDGDGKPCPKCAESGREGVLRTAVGRSKKTGKELTYLRCSNNVKQADGTSLCDYVAFPPKPVKKKMDGDGESCPKCGKGHLITREWKSKNDGKEKRALFCDRGREYCDFMKFDNPPKKTVPNPKGPMKGDGEVCTKCNVGHMKTYEWIGKKDGKPKRAMFCDATGPDGKRSCDNVVWDNEDKPKINVAKLPGDGEICTECKKGHMVTRGYKDKKTGETKSFLSCDAYPKCKHSVFPDSKKKGR